MTTSPARSDANVENGWRAPLLDALLWVTALLGSLWLAVSLAGNPASQFAPRGIVAEVLLALVWTAAIFKRLPGAVRLGFLLITFFGVASINVVDFGPVAFGVLLPMTLLLLIAMLYDGVRGSVAAGSAMLILYLVGAYGWMTGRFPLYSIAINNDPRSLFIWIRGGVGQLTASAVIAAIVFYVLAHERHTMAALRASEDRALLLHEHAPEAIVVLDMNTQRFVVANPAAESLFGYSRAELLGKSPVDLSPERQPDGSLSRDAVAALASAAAAGAKSTFEWTHRDAHGREFVSEVRLLRLPDPSRVLVRSSVLDITERKQTEAALKQSLALLQATLSAAPVGIARLHNRIFMEVSGAFAQMLGYSREELIGRDARMIYATEEEYRAVATQYLILAKQNFAVRESRFKTKDGRIVDAAVNSVWLDANDRDAGVIVAFMDITERNALHARLRQSQKLEAIGTLAGGIAHDFNNILTGILGYTALASQALAGNGPVREYLEQIGRAGRRAADLVWQILAFSRTGEPARSPVQMRDIVNEAIELLRATIPASIVFDLRLADDLPLVLANGSQLHQIVVNLGINAAHAMGDRSGTLSVQLAAREVDEAQASLLSGIEPGAHVCLTVTDTGCGMDAATLQRAFEPFFTTKERGEGTGLGLSVIHGIVRGNHGAIRLSSTLGVGTTVEIFLPATATATATASAAEPQPERATVPMAQHGHGERILLVDDVESLVVMGELVLRQLGYVAEGETQALQALARIEQDPHWFQLVVTDQTMPGMSGLELAARIRAIRPDLPVVLTSGLATTLTRERLASAGVREVLSKPYTAEELAGAVLRHLKP